MVLQNDVSQMRTQGIDLKIRVQSVLKDIASQIDFTPDDKQLRQSEWLNTGKIGAVHIPGNLKSKRCVLKIQGTKPRVSEKFMISSFKKQNKSKIIRPPKLYKHLEWNEEKQYEALFLEEVVGECVITNRPVKEDQLNEFFDLYEEYRKNCFHSPWVEKPQQYSYRNILTNWRSAVQEHYNNDTFKSPEDEELIEEAVKQIERKLTLKDTEFMHGHFQPGDLIKTSKGEVVLFSNLFWSWRNPFYDATFAYHWWMLGMEHVENLTEEILEHERKKWLDKIYAISNANNRLLHLARLERAIASLMVDRFMMDRKKPWVSVIIEGIRREIQDLLKEL